MSQYFETFGIGQYNGEYCRMIINRTAIARDVVKLTSAFYPYQLIEGERPDTVSLLYYNEPTMEWLVFFANDIVDPYYDWYLTGEQFNNYIADKYGSLAKAQLKIHHFCVNWVGDDSKLTVSGYDVLPSVTPINAKQYWQPVLNDYGVAVYYIRKPMDTTLNSNLTIAVTVDSSDGFTDGEIVSQEVGGVVVGYGEVAAISGTTITIDRVVGTFTAGHAIVGFDNQATQQVMSADTLAQNIPDEELIYWRPVSCFEHEEYLNEQKKVLKLVNREHAPAAQDNLSTLMKN